MSSLRRPWESLPSAVIVDPFAASAPGSGDADGSADDAPGRCDACGAIARVRVTVAARGDLLFCWTDFLVHEQALAAGGFVATSARTGHGSHGPAPHGGGPAADSCW
ncbi:hypothetical protein LEP48_03060 [Isoptericola sp. NEAU-Y5]|uniref:DUF7455 domain-containing protein n=1 Tax=Isoptericola luteus TaxID=2879484 RepID=A0ABS7ZBB5_9MICO|nr:hypothetical protein [Isoptericola sp. NEAU-Y5]MCA5892330.1 hypothetical protein [Isoptericola sp. NEAU-Y5]